ncbi:RNA-binding protein [Bacillus sp. BRMEA1]|uniref:YlmH family RNA-binding protein n=1 Tax=Neobacillus endophyticus TaxID=2738405 RepID=UPI001563B31A|nr:RNA-binding protein [Neobacillus endophyticus]NRD78800.1 RNA-binding protein [Neobacillus endophyticus]
MNIYQHFRPEERDYIDQVINWKNVVERQFAPKLTDFLDPREQHILKLIVGENGDITSSFFGGIQEAERKRALIFPDYWTASEDDFQLSLFEIVYPKKFVTIEHPQVLGSLMSIGLKRGKFGDILFSGDQAQFFAAKEVKDYIQTNIESIGKATVALKEIPLKDAIISKEMWENVDLTVSSLRLDTVISGIYHLSRQKSQTFIERGLVKVNWTTVENSSFLCDVGDMISVRGYGRAKIVMMDGKTKKDKWRMTVGKQK